MSLAITTEAVPQSKVTVPCPPPGALKRTRCMELLDVSSAYPLTLVSASAGWGKTTLVAQWAAARPPTDAVAWLTLGHEDGDRRRFLIDLTAALRAAVPDLAAMDVPSTADLDGFLAGLIARLADITVVLDGAERVHAPAVLADIEQLASQAAPSVHMVMTARSDPSLGLQRRRLAGGLFEIRARDLAFEEGEVAAMLAMGGVAISDSNRALLLDRTEGWPAALALAVIALQGHADADGFVRTFGGTDRAVSDYLTSEVLSGLDPAAMDLLVRTSILDEVSEDLAAAVMGEPGAGEPLGELARSEGIVTSTDRHGVWFRYHPLLLESLRARLRRLPRGEVVELHRRAAEWFSERRLTLPALEHRAAAGEWASVADVVSEAWLIWHLRGRGDLLEAALERVPDEVIEAHPELGLALGSLLSESEPTRGRELAERAVAAAGALDVHRRSRFALHERAFGLAVSNDVEELSRAAAVEPQEWTGLAPRAVDDLRAVILCNLGEEYFWRGRTARAIRHLEESCGLAEATDNDHLLVRSRSLLAAVYTLVGRPREGRTLADAAVHLARRKAWDATPQVAMAYWALAVMHLVADDPAAADRWLSDGQAAVAGSGDPQLRLAIGVARAHHFFLTGDSTSALQVVRVAERGAPRDGWQAARAVALEVSVHLAAGDTARAHQRLTEAAAMLPDAILASCWAHVHMAMGDPAAALVDVEGEWDPARRTPEHASHALALRAIAHEELGDSHAADVSLEASLACAEPAESRHFLAHTGGAMQELLRRHVRRGGRHAAFAGSIVSAKNGAPRSTDPLLPLELLSDRELAVLRFLPTMLSNAEIAAELFISVNTVKTHLRHIYRKLDVEDRRQAVERGRQLRLLNPGLAGR